MSITPILPGAEVEKPLSTETQAETAMDDVGEIYELLLVVTKSLFPSKETPDPYLPGANSAPSFRVPVAPFPLTSFVVVPEPSSNL